MKLSYWPFLCRLIGRFSKSPKVHQIWPRNFWPLFDPIHPMVCLHANIMINIWQVMQKQHTFSTNEIAGGKTWYSRDMDLERNISNIMTMQLHNINIFYNSYCENKCQDTIFYGSMIVTKDIFYQSLRIKLFHYTVRAIYNTFLQFFCYRYLIIPSFVARLRT